MASFCPKHIGQRKTTFMGGDVGSASTGRIKEGLVKVNLNGNSGSSTKTKEEEENAALASKGQ